MIVSFSDVAGALQGGHMEAAAERMWAFVCARTNYSDAFVDSDEAISGKVVRRYSKWEKTLDDGQRDKTLMLANIDSTVSLFCKYLSDGIPEVADLVSLEDDVFLSELRQFVAMKIFEAKADAASQGRPAFLSSEGMRAALALVMRKENRKFSHEARGRAAKYSHEAEDITEEKIREIVSDVWNERYDALFTILPSVNELPLAAAPLRALNQQAAQG
jgi:hypothetical protein